MILALIFQILTELYGCADKTTTNNHKTHKTTTTTKVMLKYVPLLYFHTPHTYSHNFHLTKNTLSAFCTSRTGTLSGNSVGKSQVLVIRSTTHIFDHLSKLWYNYIIR